MFDFYCSQIINLLGPAHIYACVRVCFSMVPRHIGQTLAYCCLALVLKRCLHYERGIEIYYKRAERRRRRCCVRALKLKTYNLTPSACFGMIVLVPVLFTTMLGTVPPLIAKTTMVITVGRSTHCACMSGNSCFFCA